MINSASESASVSPATSVAIIGAGQLGFMLCEAARPLGITTLVVTPDEAAPARHAADHSIVAPLDDPELVDLLAERVDAVTYELEAVPDATLHALQAMQASGRLQVHPDPGVLLLLKNKARQKNWLAENGFPTLPYVVLESPAAERDALLAELQPPLVQKAQQGGYDGYGVQVLETAADLERLWPAPSVFEPFLANVREVAVVVARATSGEVMTYAPVDILFDPERNILDVVRAPAELSAELDAAARALAAAIVERLQGVGVFAVELFVTDEQQLLVNEISPRVHNAGHHTIEAAATSQFTQHMRAVAGLPLGSVEQSAPAVMQNLLYADELAPLCSRGPGRVPTADTAVAVHWYGKREPRPGRKMGHVTVVGDDLAGARQRISQTLAALATADNGAAA